MADVEVRPLMTYICAHLVRHDGVEYEAGSEFRCSDDKVIAALRQARAILLPTEVQRAEDVAARQAALESENAELRAELEQLRAQGAQPSASAKRGKEAAAAPLAE